MVSKERGQLNVAGAPLEIRPFLKRFVDEQRLGHRSHAKFGRVEFGHKKLVEVLYEIIHGTFDVPTVGFLQIFFHVRFLDDFHDFFRDAHDVLGHEPTHALCAIRGGKGAMVAEHVGLPPHKVVPELGVRLEARGEVEVEVAVDLFVVFEIFEKGLVRGRVAEGVHEIGVFDVFRVAGPESQGEGQRIAVCGLIPAAAGIQRSGEELQLEAAVVLVDVFFVVMFTRTLELHLVALVDVDGLGIGIHVDINFFDLEIDEFAADLDAVVVDQFEFGLLSSQGRHDVESSDFFVFFDIRSGVGQQLGRLLLALFALAWPVLFIFVVPIFLL
jgi:hypothetical protein